jgi:hypothetical protein
LDLEEKVLNNQDEDVQKNLVKNGNTLHSPSTKFSISNILNILLILNILIIYLDEKVVKEVEELGYPKELVIKHLINNELNYATAAYYLFLEYEMEF